MLTGEREKLPGILTGIGGHRPDLTLVEQVPLIVQLRYVGQVDAGDREDAAAVERFECGRHEVATGAKRMAASRGTGG
ncbi:hypothetical protein NJ76_02820, partial [Rhodococcus sp. IITR03]